VSRLNQSEPISITQRLGVLRPDSIRIKILVLAVLATLLPSLATTWISYLENERSLEAKATEELLSVSAQSARELDLWVKERRYELRVFASSYEVTENVPAAVRAGGRAAQAAGSSQRLTDYLKSVRERFDDYGELLVVDPNGQVVASSGEYPDAFALPADWQAQLRSDDFVLGPPYWDSADDRPEMLIAVPIRAAGDRLLGTITAEVNLQALAATLKNFAPGESGRVSLLTEAGNVVVTSHDATAEVMALRYEFDAVRALAGNDGRPSEFTNVLGQQVLGSMRPVPGLGWVVVAEIPSEEVFGQLAQLRNITLLIVAATLTLVGGLGYALGLFIVRPLDRLTKAAASVASGDLEVDLTGRRGRLSHGSLQRHGGAFACEPSGPRTALGHRSSHGARQSSPNDGIATERGAAIATAQAHLRRIDGGRRPLQNVQRYLRPSRGGRRAQATGRHPARGDSRCRLRFAIRRRGVFRADAGNHDAHRHRLGQSPPCAVCGTGVRGRRDYDELRCRRIPDARRYR
jgi:HAMP domain-containing protein